VSRCERAWRFEPTHHDPVERLSDPNASEVIGLVALPAEPASLTLLAAGLFGLGVFARRHKSG
jgi:hypothetical protein